MDIDKILDSIHLISDSSKDILKECVWEVTLPKGCLLLNADKIESNIYFIKKGMARAYSNNEANEVTFWFGKEGDTIVSMKSYVSNCKGYENIELLEDCELYELKTKELQNLFDSHIDITNWGRRFAEQELLKTEERLISRQFKTATQRYTELLNNNSDLVKRVQLGHIASYLGITQVSLSRIRASIK